MGQLIISKFTNCLFLAVLVLLPATVMGAENENINTGIQLARMLKELKLSDQQQSQINEIFENDQLVQVQFQNQRNRLELRYQELISSGSIEPATQRSINQARQSLNLRTKMQKVKVHQQVMSVLTMEQKEKVVEKAYGTGD